MTRIAVTVARQVVIERGLPILVSADMEWNGTDKDAGSTLIGELRQLRTDVLRLNSGLVKRLKPFQKIDGSFKTLPISKDKSKELGAQDISVASTCTVLMAAIGVGKAAIGGDKEDRLLDEETIREVFRKTVVEAKWGSSGLAWIIHEQGGKGKLGVFRTL